MTCVFQESFRFTSSYESLGKFRFTSSYESPVHRGFPLAVALKKFWLCFAPRYAPLLWDGQERKVDPYARAPTQHLFQEDRSKDVDDETGIRFTHVSTSRIPSIAAFVSSFPFIKNLRLALDNASLSLAPLSQMRLLTDLSLGGATSKHLSEIVNVSVKNLELWDFKGENLSPLFPQAQQQGRRLQRSLRRLTLYCFVQLTDISALAGFETLLELKLDFCSSLTDLSSIARLKELRVLRVAGSGNLGMNSFVKAFTRLEFILELDISFGGEILDEHVRKIATIETLEKLKLIFLRASSESLSMLLNPQNLPNLRELITNSTSSPFKHCAGSGTCVNLEKLDLNFHRDVKLDSTDISIISKKFPNLTSLNLSNPNLEDGTDFSPLGDLNCLSNFRLYFCSEFTPIQSASLESAIPKLVNLQKLEFMRFPSHVDVKKMLLPLRKLEILSCYTELEASTMNTILDLIEEEGHLPGFFRIGSRERNILQYRSMKEEFIPELLEMRRKQRIEEEHLQQSKKQQQERQAERRERDQEEEESETDNTAKKKKRKKK